MTGHQLVRRSNGGGVSISAENLDPIQLGEVLARSGFFQDSRDAAQAAVKVMAGAELGFGPVASMTGIYIVKGRVTLSANLMAAAINSHPRYTYRVKTHTAEECVIDFLEDGQVIGTSSFTMQNAAQAGLAGGENWKKHPRNMLFARALSNGAKWYCPDAFGGGPIYTPDELDVEVDRETGEVLNPQALTPLPPVTTTPAQRALPQPAADPVEATEPLVSPKQRGLLHARCGEVGLDDDTRHALLHCITGQPHSDRVPRRLLGHDGSGGEPRDGILGVLASAKAAQITPEQLLGELRRAYSEHGGPLGESTANLIASIPDAAVAF